MKSENRVSQHLLYRAAQYVSNAAAFGGYKASKIEENWKNIAKLSSTRTKTELKNNFQASKCTLRNIAQYHGLKT